MNIEYDKKKYTSNRKFEVGTIFICLEKQTFFLKGIYGSRLFSDFNLVNLQIKPVDLMQFGRVLNKTSNPIINFFLVCKESSEGGRVFIFVFPIPSFFVFNYFHSLPSLSSPLKKSPRKAGFQQGNLEQTFSKEISTPIPYHHQ